MGWGMEGITTTTIQIFLGDMFRRVIKWCMPTSSLKERKEGRKESQNATVVSSDETCAEPSNICVFPFSW